MRFLMKINIPVETGNAAAKAGKLGSTIQAILAEAKPEAAYFSDSDGQRTGYLFVDLADASRNPRVRRTLVPGIQRRHRDSSGDGPRRPGQGGPRHQEGGQEIRLIGPAHLIAPGPTAPSVTLSA